MSEILYEVWGENRHGVMTRAVLNRSLEDINAIDNREPIWQTADKQIAINKCREIAYFGRKCEIREAKV